MCVMAFAPSFCDEKARGKKKETNGSDEEGFLTDPNENTQKHNNIKCLSERIVRFTCQYIALFQLYSKYLTI